MTLSGMFCGEPMTYETLVMYGGELIAIPESTVVDCFCEQNSDSATLNYNDKITTRKVEK